MLELWMGAQACIQALLPTCSCVLSPHPQFVISPILHEEYLQGFLLAFTWHKSSSPCHCGPCFITWMFCLEAFTIQHEEGQDWVWEEHVVLCWGHSSSSSLLFECLNTLYESRNSLDQYFCFKGVINNTSNSSLACQMKISCDPWGLLIMLTFKPGS